MPNESPDARRRLINAPIVVALVCAALVAAGVWWQSTMALLMLLTDGAAAALLLGVATLAGLWIVDLFRFRELPPRWRFMLAAALGAGLLATLTLALGAAGFLSVGAFRGLLAALGVAGFVRVVLLVRNANATGASSAGAPIANAYRWLWIAAVPFFALWTLTAAVPPGLLWAEEGNGYDVLEYHLELPKAYFAAGRIAYLPHNVYANFPSNAEMLFLDAMLLRGDVLDGAATAKFANAMLAALFVAAAWLAGRETSDRAGVVAGVAAATAGWVAYLSGIAYVENGMLFFGMMALAALLRATRNDAPATDALKWTITGGFLAGLACGFKYTGVALVALPIAVAVPILVRGSVGRRVALTAAFGVAAIVAFAPWLAKNAAMTGNPVFPLANSVFGASPPGWDTAASQHFDASHAPAPNEQSLSGRMAALWKSVPADAEQRFSPMLFLLAAAALVSPRRTRTDWGCAAILAVQVLVWLFATHLYARFAVPMLAPLVVLAGRSIDAWNQPLYRGAAVACVLIGAAISATTMASLYASHVFVNGEKLPIDGRFDVFTGGAFPGHEHLAVINKELPADARILIIGDAKAFYIQRPVDYCVVFNRNPFIEEVRAADDARAIVDWLRKNGYTHVLVNWAEINRLRKSRYGFPDEATPELFRRLVDAGLIYDRSFSTPDMKTPYADLFVVPPR